MRAVARRPVIAERNPQRRHRPDHILVLLCVLLLAVGLVVVYSISPSLSIQRQVSENYYISKQIIAVLLGIAAFTIAASVPMSFWKNAQRPLIFLAVLAAVAVQLFGERVNGAYRWVHIGGLSFQAVELIKLAVVVWLAAFLTQRVTEGSLGDWRKTVRPLAIAVGIIGVVVGVFESDLGSTAVIMGIIGAMCFVAGFPLKRILLFCGVIALGVVLLISTTAYRRERFATYMNPERDCMSSGYQACQALIAVGSGGLFGKGLGRSVQATGYLPEAANDSIFAIMGEKFGFVGLTAIILLFVALFTRLKNILERAPDHFSKYMIAGILAWLSTQTIINVGAMIGVLPLKGITLPLVSYGGTSIIFVSLIIGIAFHVSRFTSLSSSADKSESSRNSKVVRTYAATYPARGR